MLTNLMVLIWLPNLYYIEQINWKESFLLNLELCIPFAFSFMGFGFPKTNTWLNKSDGNCFSFVWIGGDCF